MRTWSWGRRGVWRCAVGVREPEDDRLGLLRSVVALRREVRAELDALVDQLVAAELAEAERPPWAQLAEALEMRPQSAWERYGPGPRPKPLAERSSKPAEAASSEEDLAPATTTIRPREDSPPARQPPQDELKAPASSSTRKFKPGRRIKRR